MGRDENERTETWAVAAKVVLTAGPFVLLLALFALHLWIGR